MKSTSKKNKSFRKLSSKLKTAKGRKISSTRWLTRHINDKYVILAKQNKYRSRAAFKLLEIIEKFPIIHTGTKNIADLGCAPGSWLQILKIHSKKLYKIIGIDLQEMESIEGIDFILGDFLDSEIQQKAIEKISTAHKSSTAKFDLILSDMAAKSCGNPQVDHLRIMLLADSVFNFAEDNLKEGGNLVVKILRGVNEHDFYKRMKKSFKKVKCFKPDASYKDSAEIYVIGMNYLPIYTLHNTS